ncbi:hypothetical protein MPER_04680 [Moniliophthora perniciosa FA553]|nr:hypothetical protein MPER_04680 [Moniliophthora perniciosa FA553]
MDTGRLRVSKKRNRSKRQDPFVHCPYIYTTPEFESERKFEHIFRDHFFFFPSYDFRNRIQPFFCISTYLHTGFITLHFNWYYNLRWITEFPDRRLIVCTTSFIDNSKRKYDLDPNLNLNLGV